MSKLHKMGDHHRIQTIQAFRAFAIIAVVMIHTIPGGLPQVFIRPFVNFAVATFVFLSGYLTKLEYDNWSKFFSKRISRVLIPYIIWTLIFCLPGILENINSGLVRFFKDLLTAQAKYTLYYIFVYIQLVLLTPLLCTIAKKKYSLVVWITPPILLLIFKYLPIIWGMQPSGIINLINSDSCYFWIGFYYLGMLYGNGIIVRDYSLATLSWVYILTLLIQMGESYLWYKYGLNNCGSQGKLSCLLSSTVFLMMTYTAIKRKMFKSLGLILSTIALYSFGIYLSHPLLMDLMCRIGILGNFVFPLNSIIVLVVSLLFCWLLSKLFGPKLSRWFGLE